MQIDTLVLGDFQTNCYVLRQSADSKQCLLIDPGMGAEPLVQLLEANDYQPEWIILTHGHADHIGGVESIRRLWPDVQVAIHEGDAEMMTDPNRNLSVLAGGMVQARPADVLLDSKTDMFKAAGLRFGLIHTPGHSPGGICLYSADEHLLFAGDTLFCGSVGRTDFPGGNYAQLIEMIKTKLMILPDKTKVYCGHGLETTIGLERKNNPFLE